MSHFGFNFGQKLVYALIARMDGRATGIFPKFFTGGNDRKGKVVIDVCVHIGEGELDGPHCAVGVRSR